MVDDNWRPSAAIEQLNKRAELLALIRRFFAQRNVLEVETPLLSHYSVTDPHLDAFSVDEPALFLQTSPEYAMKRLLAAGSGPIYQLGKAFRKAERGSRHNPEFTMLEWYRPGYDHLQLMDEVAALIGQVLGTSHNVEQITYRQAFEQYLGIDPHGADLNSLKAIADQYIDIQMRSDNCDDWLNLLLAEVIEPELGRTQPVFLYEYPVSQAALAKVGPDSSGVMVAQRFELYINGIEVANGYHELTDVAQLEKRFVSDQTLRAQLGKAHRAADKQLLAAMRAGLPDCAGVALGVDRLLMLAQGADSIDQVLAFPIERA